jgi:hypothetical protein
MRDHSLSDRFTTILVAYIFVLLSVVHERMAISMIYLDIILSASLQTRALLFCHLAISQIKENCLVYFAFCE